MPATLLRHLALDYNQLVATELGNTLPDDLIAALEDPSFESLAVPLITTDRQGYPHIAMLSFLEIIPRRKNRLEFFVHSGSRTAIFLQRNKICTLMLADQHFVYYLKGSVQFLGNVDGHVVFLLTVRTALQDCPTEAEVGTGLTSGLRFQAPESEFARRRRLRQKVKQRLAP